jgi:O-antigen/teichoic acid export membrane protein
MGEAFVTPDASEAPAGRRVVRNSALNLGAFGLNAGFNLLAVMVLARRLPEEVFGRYCAAYAILIFVQVITEAGIPTVLTCRLAARPGAWNKTSAEAFGLLGLVVLAASIACLGFSVVMEWSLLVAAVLSSAIAGIHVQRFCAGVFAAAESFVCESLAKVLQSGAFALFVALWVNPGHDGFLFPLTLIAASQAIGTVILVGALARQRPCLPTWPTLRTVRDWLAHSGPLGLGDVIRRLAAQVDILILGFVQAPAAVAIYSIGVRPLSTVNWLPQVVLAAVLPSFARLARSDRRSLQRVFAKTTCFAGLAGLPIALALCFLAEPVVAIIAGRDYLAAAVPMRIVAWNALLLSLSASLRFLLVAVGAPRLYGLSAAVALFIEIVALLALIPQFGYFGACAGLIVGELAYLGAGAIAARAVLSGEGRAVEEKTVVQEAPAPVSV